MCMDYSHVKAYQEQRCQAWRRQAGRRQVDRMAGQRRSRSPKVLRLALCWAGSKLVGLGEKLQRQGASVPAVSRMADES